MAWLKCGSGKRRSRLKLEQIGSRNDRESLKITCCRKCIFILASKCASRRWNSRLANKKKSAIGKCVQDGKTVDGWHSFCNLDSTNMTWTMQSNELHRRIEPRAFPSNFNLQCASSTRKTNRKRRSRYFPFEFIYTINDPHSFPSSPSSINLNARKRQRQNGKKSTIANFIITYLQCKHKNQRVSTVYPAGTSNFDNFQIVLKLLQRPITACDVLLWRGDDGGHRITTSMCFFIDLFSTVKVSHSNKSNRIEKNNRKYCDETIRISAAYTWPVTQLTIYARCASSMSFSSFHLILATLS